MLPILNDQQIKDITFKLNVYSDLFYHSDSDTIREHSRGYCQGVAYILSQIGYTIKWDYGKATIVRE